jgi:large subunit ribosomal protein L6
MSRIGQKLIEVPKGVTVTINGATLSGKGPGGEMTVTIPGAIEAKLSDGKLTVVPRDADAPDAGSLHGTARTLIANMVQGLQKPFNKDLEIQGVGFKAQQQGATKLVLSLGFSHPIEFEIPKGITVKVTDGTAVSVSGADKQLVGQVSSIIRGYFPAEPYKGKGVRYKGEHVRRKAGKAVA